MKKSMFNLTLALILTVQCLTTSAFAKTGDIAGDYYATDIITTLNGFEIDSINIGGYTLISAEDMMHYGFIVVWNAEERTLRVMDNPYSPENIPPAVRKESLPTGTVMGNYYETDIITYLDGKPITAYNIGGRTYIHGEEMSRFGYLVTWSESERSLTIKSPDKAGYVYTIPLTKGEEQSKEGTGAFSVQYTKDGIISSGDAEYFDLTFSGVKHGYEITMAFYQYQGLYYSSKLLNAMKEISYDGYGIENPCAPEDKYNAVNEVMEISINGQKAQQVEVTAGAGNGHRDYYISVKDLPRFTEEEIKKITVSVLARD